MYFTHNNTDFLRRLPAWGFEKVVKTVKQPSIYFFKTTKP